MFNLNNLIMGHEIRLLTLCIILISLVSCKMANNQETKDIYTLGIWNAKPGKQKELIEEWTKFANWTSNNVSGPGRAYLLQDENDSLRFISFGPWDNESSIHHWRETQEFKNFVAKVNELCDDFQPNTLRVASTSD